MSFDDTFIPGTLRIRTKGGNDSIGGTDSGTGGKTYIDMGAGNDGITFDGGFGPGLKLYNGGGDDTVDFLDVTFHGKTTFDGGRGNDRFVLGGFEVVPGPPIVVHLETIESPGAADTAQ